MPLERTGDFLDWFLREVPVEPVWVCPLRLRATGPAAPPRRRDALADLPAGGRETYVNVGFWSTVPILPGGPDGDVNRSVERVVAELGGQKSLYCMPTTPRTSSGRCTAAPTTACRRTATTRTAGCWTSTQDGGAAMTVDTGPEHRPRSTLGQIFDELFGLGARLRFTAYDGSSAGDPDATTAST